MAMTNEEIDAEIKRLQALKEQNNQAQTTESNNPADGIHNPADYISQITSKMNEASYTDEQGNKKSYGRGDKFSKNLDVAKNAGKIGNRTEDQFGNPLPDTAYEYIVQMLNSERAKGSVSKHTLRMIENEAKARYNLPSNFDISGKGWFGNTDAAMARAMNSMAYNGKAQQTQPAQTPKPVQTSQTQSTQNQQTQSTQNQQTQGTQGTQGTSDISPKVKIDNERTAAYKRIKAKQASDADLALFKNYTEEQLKKIGFGPISIKAIKDAAGTQTQQTDTTQQTSEGLSDEEKQFMQQYKQYTQQLSGSQPSSQAALKTMQESEVHKFVTDPANTERYNNLVKKQNEANKANKQRKTDKSMEQKIAAAKEDNASYGDMGTFGE